uniref:Uncharacterized protein n=1 Tax=uncultured Desulfobacterium sp. TaxID=201089 RepID=E1YIL4_9BACT|nr:unknown protein [uncultured Desulfobacterium sp.]
MLISSYRFQKDIKIIPVIKQLLISLVLILKTEILSIISGII